ncbi:MAG TPA: hypothetical protein VIG32_05715 [Candidatus Baltobacteraceae bacterium]|jgi:uncharacterized protein involved in exopolysaccharide biosynthesis/Mrp family chromosome partitioning ATPase
MLLVDNHIAPSPPENLRRLDLAPLLWFWRRRARLILGVFAIFVIIVAAITLLTPRSYTTTAQLIVGNPAGPAPAGTIEASNLPILNALLTASSAQTPETYAALFQQVPVAQSVVDSLHLKTTGAGLLGAVEVVPVTNTSLLDVSVTWSDAATSAAIANAFATAVIARQRQLVASQANDAIAFLSQELPKARSQAQQTNSALAAYSAAHHLPSMDSDTQTTLATLASLDSRANETKILAQQAKAQLASARSQLRTLPAQILGSTQLDANPVVAQMQAQLAQVDVQLRNARANFTDKHPTVLNLEQQRSDLQREIAARRTSIVAGSSRVPNPVYQQVQSQVAVDRSQVSAAQAELAEIDRQRGALEPQLAALPRQSALFAELLRSAKSAQAVYAALQGKLNDANIAKSTALSDVTVTAPALAELATKRPRLLANLLLAAIVGAFLALVAALLFDAADSSLIEARRAERDLSLPVIASIPDMPGEVTTVRAAALQEATIESFVGLASLLKFAPGDARTIGITSSGHAEGRSTVSLNLALALGEMGERVLLVDASRTRRVSNAAILAKGEPGFYEVLGGLVPLEKAVKRTREERVDLLTCGNPKDSFRMLAPDRIDAFVSRAQQSYRFVLFNAPAISDGIESALLLRSVDRWLMVVCDGVTNLGAARTALQSVRRHTGENIAGTVINRVPLDRIDYLTRVPARPAAPAAAALPVNEPRRVAS